MKARPKPESQANEIKFFVPGIPVPGGSKRAFVLPGGKRAAIVDAAGQNVKNWKADIKRIAWEHRPERLFDGAIELKLVFLLRRPQSHYRSGRYKNFIKSSSPLWHMKQPDLTKLLRSTEDALTGVIWKDDNQVHKINAEKIYSSETSGVEISVTNKPW